VVDSKSRPASDKAPDSHVRALAERGSLRALCVATRLRGAEAEASLVTVTDETGAIHFEGPLAADGSVTVSLPPTAAIQRVSVRLETARWHRQADVTLGSGLTEHPFT
jgi:hypothetical protein